MMDLFQQVDSTLNYLPYEGVVHYYGPIMNVQSADDYYTVLMDSIAWQHDQALIFGKQLITKRKVAWYGDQAFSYTYSKMTKTALPWTPALLQLKAQVEQISNEQFNSCLLNLYHSGNEGMAWHSDGERDLKKEGAIASLSFGAERKFSFKHKRTLEKIDLILAHGSLLMMKDCTQSHWLHRLAPTKRIFNPRINLTFRWIENQS